MDFKSLISKIESIDGRVITPKAPELPKTMQLNEDAELRVLAGTSTYIVEANKKAEETVDESQDDLKKVGDKVKTTHGTMTKTASGVKHERSYGKDKDKDEDDEDAPKAKKAKKESIEPEFKSKFMKMVEAKKEEKETKKKEKKMAEAVTLKPGAKERAEKEKQDRAAEEKRRAESPGVSLKKKPMGEAAKPDFLDLDKDGDKKEPMKSAAKAKGGDKKDSGKKGMSAAQEKYFGKKNESVKTSKKVVAESVETSLTFKEMVKLVQESGGQQQIDPLDKALFTWAERVAKAKLGEGLKADLYAGLIYERNGGVFEIYDILAEDQK